MITLTQAEHTAFKNTKTTQTTATEKNSSAKLMIEFVTNAFESLSIKDMLGIYEKLRLGRPKSKKKNDIVELGGSYGR